MPNHQLNLGPLPLHRVTEPFAAEAKPSVTPRQSVKWAEILEIAFDRARLQRKSVADDMGKSNSWFCRALKGVEKLGWLDLGLIQDKTFWSEVVSMICDVHGIQPPGVSAEDQQFIKIGKAYCELQQQVARSQVR